MHEDLLTIEKVEVVASPPNVLTPATQPYGVEGQRITRAWGIVPVDQAKHKATFYSIFYFHFGSDTQQFSKRSLGKQFNFYDSFRRKYFHFNYLREKQRNVDFISINFC